MWDCNEGGKESECSEQRSEVEVEVEVEEVEGTNVKRSVRTWGKRYA